MNKDDFGDGAGAKKVQSAVSSQAFKQVEQPSKGKGKGDKGEGKGKRGRREKEDWEEDYAAPTARSGANLAAFMGIEIVEEAPAPAYPQTSSGEGQIQEKIYRVSISTARD